MVLSRNFLGQVEIVLIHTHNSNNPVKRKSKFYRVIKGESFVDFRAVKGKRQTLKIWISVKRYKIVSLHELPETIQKMVVSQSAIQLQRLRQPRMMCQDGVGNEF